MRVFANAAAAIALFAGDASQCRQLVRHVEHGLADDDLTFALSAPDAANLARLAVVVVVDAGSSRPSALVISWRGDGNALDGGDDRARVRLSVGLRTIGAEGRELTSAGGTIGVSGHHRRWRLRPASSRPFADAASASETAHTAKGP